MGWCWSRYWVLALGRCLLFQTKSPHDKNHIDCSQQVLSLIFGLALTRPAPPSYGSLDWWWHQLTPTLVTTHGHTPGAWHLVWTELAAVCPGILKGSPKRLRAWISLKYKVNAARAWYFRQIVHINDKSTFFHSLILAVEDPSVWRSPCYPWVYAGSCSISSMILPCQPRVIRNN